MGKPKILVTRRVSPECLDLLKPHFDIEHYDKGTAIPRAKLLKSGKYEGWDPLMILGSDVFGKTLGVIGFGRIGQAVAKRATGFSMKTLYYDTRRAAPEAETALNAAFVPLDDLLRASDFVSVHTVL